MNNQDSAFATKEDKVIDSINSMYQTYAALDPLLPDLYAKLLYCITDGDPARYSGNAIPDRVKVDIDPKKGIVIVTDKNIGIHILLPKLDLWLINSDVDYEILDRRRVWQDLYNNEISPTAVLEEYGSHLHKHLFIDDTAGFFWMNEEAVGVMHQLLIQREQLYKEKGFKTYLFIGKTEFGPDPKISAQRFIENQYLSDSYIRIMQISNLTQVASYWG